MCSHPCWLAIRGSSKAFIDFGKISSLTSLIRRTKFGGWKHRTRRTGEDGLLNSKRITVWRFGMMILLVLLHKSYCKLILGSAGMNLMPSIWWIFFFQVVHSYSRHNSHSFHAIVIDIAHLEFLIRMIGALCSLTQRWNTHMNLSGFVCGMFCGHFCLNFCGFVCGKFFGTCRGRFWRKFNAFLKCISCLLLKGIVRNRCCFSFVLSKRLFVLPTSLFAEWCLQAEPRHREYRSSANLNPMRNSSHFHIDSVSSIQCVDWSVTDFKCYINYQFPTDASGEIWQRWWRLSAWSSMIVIADYLSYWWTVWSRGVQACLCPLVCRRSSGGSRFHWGSWSSRPLRKHEEVSNDIAGVEREEPGCVAWDTWWGLSAWSSRFITSLISCTPSLPRVNINNSLCQLWCRHVLRPCFKEELDIGRQPAARTTSMNSSSRWLTRSSVPTRTSSPKSRAWCLTWLPSSRKSQRKMPQRRHAVTKRWRRLRTRRPNLRRIWQRWPSSLSSQRPTRRSWKTEVGVSMMLQPAAPEKHGKSGGAGWSIISILEVCESDFSDNLAKEEAAESDSQAMY